MKPKFFTGLLAISLLLADGYSAMAKLPVGQIPPAQLLVQRNGDPEWRSPELFLKESGKVHVIFYNAPLSKDLNKKASSAITSMIDTSAKLNFKREFIRSWAIVNVNATWWLPARVIRSRVDEARTEYPHTTFALDENGDLAKSWNLGEPTTSHVVVIGVDSKVAFSFDGELGAKDIQQLIQVIDDETRALFQRRNANESALLHKS